MSRPCAARRCSCAGSPAAGRASEGGSALCRLVVPVATPVRRRPVPDWWCESRCPCQDLRARPWCFWAAQAGQLPLKGFLSPGHGMGVHATLVAGAGSRFPPRWGGPGLWPCMSGARARVAWQRAGWPGARPQIGLWLDLTMHCSVPGGLVDTVHSSCPASARGGGPFEHRSPPRLAAGKRALLSPEPTRVPSGQH